MDCSFVRYRSIVDDTTGLVDESIEGDWIVTPKVHGTNLSVIICSGDSIEDATICRRNGIISDDENFYGVHDVVEELGKSFASIAARWPLGTPITVYGELFGGHYLGVTSRKQGVQKGVCYSARVQFVAFDIRTDADGYLGYSLACDIFDAEGMPRIPIYYQTTGRLGEALAWARDHAEDHVRVADFTSEELPALEDNVGEGYVVRSSRGGTTMIKVKSKRFAEQSGDDFLTFARVVSVLSKEPIPIEQTATQKLIDLVLDDAHRAAGATSRRDEKKARALVNRYLDSFHLSAEAADSAGAAESTASTDALRFLAST